MQMASMAAPQGMSLFGTTVPVDTDTRQRECRATGPVDDCMDSNMSDMNDTEESGSEGKGSPRPETDQDRMHELIALQAFDGSWKWTERLFSVVGMEEQKVKAALAGFDEAVAATMLVVAFLEGKMSDEEEVWEMVVEKAKGWLEERVGQAKYEAGLATIMKDLPGTI